MSNLIRLIGRRLLALPLMVLGVTLLVFVVMSWSSVDPARPDIEDKRAINLVRVCNCHPALVNLIGKTRASAVVASVD